MHTTERLTVNRRLKIAPNIKMNSLWFDEPTAHHAVLRRPSPEKPLVEILRSN